MMKYTKEYIAQLLERFMNGTSTLEEESVLANYFRHTAVPEEWAAYKEMFAYIDGTWTLDEAVERIKGNTRRYARKQLTWYKKDEQIRWFNPDDKNSIISYISQDYEQQNI